jgi:dihydrofolate synthase/folylpolyglutamate synthase
VEPATAVQWIAGLDLMGMRFGLERMNALMAALGQPCRGLPAVHVVGTNGKTSVTRMTAAFLTASGWRTGAYISPHVIDWSERIALDGAAIPPDAFAAAATRVRAVVPMVEDGAITQFEALTALGLDALAHAGVEAVVLEAGLGGRLDATNVIDAPVVALSSVDLDHTEILGHSVREIAGEKLGVAPEGFAGLVVGEQAPGVLPDIRAVVTERGMSGWWLGQEITWQDGNGPVMTIRTPNGALRIEADMPARWQRANLALAVGAAERVLGRGLDEAAIAEGLSRLSNPGRLQVVPGSPVIVLDGAHNPAGARALAEALPQVLGDVRPVAVIGMMADKDAEGIVDALAPVIRCAHVTRASSGRAIRPEPIARLFARHGVPADVIAGPARALECARADAGPMGAVLVAGSLHLLSDLAPIVTGHGPSGGGTLAAAPAPGCAPATVWRLDDFRK